MRRLVPLALTVLALAGCGGSSATPAATGQQPGFDPFPAPDFALHDQDGKLVRLSDLRGHDVLVTFLYTNCPDVCPRIAATLNQALGQLDDARVLAVSVDPWGDTKAAVRKYVRVHELVPRFRYLTGTQAELQPVWKEWGIGAVATDPDVIDHTAATFLVDADGQVRDLFDAVATPAEVVRGVQKLG